MRIKLLTVAALLSLYNIFIALIITDKVYLIFAIIIGTFLGIYLLYKWMVSPISLMKKQLKAVEDENARIENIRKEFVANVSHELKTPLTSISGFIETLQNGAADDPEARTKFIEIIAIETARLKRLIQDILILSDIEGNIETSNYRFSINEVVSKVIEFLEPIAEQKKINIEWFFHNEIYLNGNEDKFTQMIVNLVENAIKYSNENTTVNVDTNETENQIIINVTDHGIGIAQNDLNRISERFYRVDKSRSTKVGGTGLGLSIVKHTATLFNGDLQIKSELGKGSTFSIVINK